MDPIDQQVREDHGRSANDHVLDQQVRDPAGGAPIRRPLSGSGERGLRVGDHGRSAPDAGRLALGVQLAGHVATVGLLILVMSCRFVLAPLIAPVVVAFTAGTISLLATVIGRDAVGVFLAMQTVVLGAMLWFFAVLQPPLLSFACSDAILQSLIPVALLSTTLHFARYVIWCVAMRLDPGQNRVQGFTLFA
jgi:hypothetical protein